MICSGRMQALVVRPITGSLLAIGIYRRMARRRSISMSLMRWVLDINEMKFWYARRCEDGQRLARMLSKRSQQSRVRTSNRRTEIGPCPYHRASLFEHSLHEHYNAFLTIAINIAVIKTTVVFLLFSTDPHSCRFPLTDLAPAPCQDNHSLCIP
jgi:hypothetical protein